MLVQLICPTCWIGLPKSTSGKGEVEDLHMRAMVGMYSLCNIMLESIVLYHRAITIICCDAFLILCSCVLQLLSLGSTLRRQALFLDWLPLEKPLWVGGGGRGWIHADDSYNISRCTSTNITIGSHHQDFHWLGSI